MVFLSALYFFPGRDAFRLSILAVRAFPIVILAVPLAVTFIEWGMYDRVYSVALLHTALTLPTTILVMLFILATYLSTDIVAGLGVNPGPIPVLSGVAVLLAGWFLRKNWHGWAFAMTATGIAASLVTLFLIMFPRVMISSTDPAYSLTVYNAASEAYTLQVMTVVTVIFLPIGVHPLSTTKE